MRLISLTILVFVALAVPATAGAVTFGSDLSAHPSNSTVTCGQFSIFQYAGRVGCSAYTAGNGINPADTAATHVIPFLDPRANGNQSGTITQVTFKPAPGAPAGPARLSVIEYIRDANSTASPGLAQDIADSANFTMAPGADGLVHVATNLPARSIYNTSDNSYRFDVLVVSMLDNTTPIPADMTSQYLSAWINPFVDIPSTQGDLTVPLPADRQGTGCCGYGANPFYAIGAWYSLGEVLMQAELTTTGSTGGGGGGGGGGGESLSIGGNGRAKGNAAILRLTCNLGAACRGKLRLLRSTTAKANLAALATPASKTVVYGRTKFSIPAHATKSVKVKLTKAGRKIMRRHRSLRMMFEATVGSEVVTGAVTVKRARK